MEKWGSMLLLIFCALVILFSALYTRQEDVKRMAAQNAAASQDETLSEAISRFCAPVSSAAAQGFQGAYKAPSGLWHFAPFVHYSVQKGEKAQAVCSGSILRCNEQEILIAGENSFLFRLTGAFSPLVKESDTVCAGQEIARIAAQGELCLSLSIDGHYTDPLQYFTPQE